MPTTHDLSAALSELADRVEDVPDLRIDGPPTRFPTTVAAVALVAIVTVLAVVGRDHPADTAVPPAAGPTPTVATPLTTDPVVSSLTPAELRAALADCDLDSVDGRPVVRYAARQSRIGTTSDTDPVAFLVLETDDGWVFCSGDESVAAAAKDWGPRRPDPAAAGVELPNGVRVACNEVDHADSQVTTTLVLRVDDRVRSMRVSLKSAGQERTVSVPPRGGFVLLPLQVVGESARQRSALEIELLDATRQQLIVQPGYGSASRSVARTLDSCSATLSRGGPQQGTPTPGG